MSDRWNRYSNEEKELAEATFAALCLRDELVGPSDAPDDAEPVRRFGLSDLFAYVNDPHYAPVNGFFEALEREPTLRSNLDSLLSRGSICRFDEAEAASTGELERRVEGSFSIQLQESHAMEGRTIVVIELEAGSERAPIAIFAERSDGRCYKIALPDAQNERIQLLVDRESGFLAAVRDPNATVTLR